MGNGIEREIVLSCIDARWVLKREYVQFHEVSRERGADGGPAYEATVFLSWDVKTSEFMCLWLDNPAAGGLSPQGIARGLRSGDTIPLVFTLSQRESLHTTFAYDRSADAWRLTIDEVTDYPLRMKDLDRSLSVALMMEWTETTINSF